MKKVLRKKYYKLFQKNPTPSKHTVFKIEEFSKILTLESHSQIASTLLIANHIAVAIFYVMSGYPPKKFH